MALLAAFGQQRPDLALKELRLRLSRFNGHATTGENCANNSSDENRQGKIMTPHVAQNHYFPAAANSGKELLAGAIVTEDVIGRAD